MKKFISLIIFLFSLKTIAALDDPFIANGLFHAVGNRGALNVYYNPALLGDVSDDIKLSSTGAGSILYYTVISNPVFETLSPKKVYYPVFSAAISAHNIWKNRLQFGLAFQSNKSEIFEEIDFYQRFETFAPAGTVVDNVNFNMDLNLNNYEGKAAFAYKMGANHTFGLSFGLNYNKVQTTRAFSFNYSGAQTGTIAESEDSAQIYKVYTASLGYLNIMEDGIIGFMVTPLKYFDGDSSKNLNFSQTNPVQNIGQKFTSPVQYFHPVSFAFGFNQTILSFLTILGEMGVSVPAEKKYKNYHLDYRQGQIYPEILHFSIIKNTSYAPYLTTGAHFKIGTIVNILVSGNLSRELSSFQYFSDIEKNNSIMREMVIEKAIINIEVSKSFFKNLISYLLINFYDNKTVVNESLFINNLDNGRDYKKRFQKLNFNLGTNYSF